MNRLIIYLTIITSLLLNSCIYRDGFINEQKVSFKIIYSGNIEDIQIHDVFSKKQLNPNEDGIYTFITPYIRTHSNTCMFIEFEGYSSKEVKFLKILKKNIILTTLSLYEFNNLPKDEAGRYVLEIKNTYRDRTPHH